MQYLTTEQSNLASEHLDELSSIEIVRLMSTEDATLAAAVACQSKQIAEAIETIARSFRAGGRLIYVGAGTSGRLGVLDASECPPTFRSKPEMVQGLIAGGHKALTSAIEGAEDDPAMGAADMESLGPTARDVVVGIATSGRTPYVLGAMQLAKKVGAQVFGLTCNQNSELSEIADNTICVVVGPEIISGSTRLKSGTATKMVLNMLTTGAMVLIGKTYGNLMVDLRASNQKLLDRALRIVCQLTGVNREIANRRLRECDFSVKTTIVAIEQDVDGAIAREILAESGGHLRNALGTPSVERASSSRSGKLFIGIDGGGSKTVAVLATLDEAGKTQIIGRGMAGCGNPSTDGVARAVSNIGRAVSNALRAAGIANQPIEAMHVGLAGAANEMISNKVKLELSQRGLAKNVSISDDVLPLFHAAQSQHFLDEGEIVSSGVVLISGTGSIAFLFDDNRPIARAGGWGPIIGDEGSGYWIATKLLNGICRIVDGREDFSSLLPLVLKSCGLENSAQLKSWINAPNTTRSQIADLAKIAFDHFENNTFATNLINDAAEELANLAHAAVNSIALAKKPSLLVLGGGLIVNQVKFQNLIESRLLEKGWKPKSIVVIDDPAVGSLELAKAEANEMEN